VKRKKIRMIELSINDTGDAKGTIPVNVLPELLEGVEGELLLNVLILVWLLTVFVPRAST
jgi:hypothetical protein